MSLPLVEFISHIIHVIPSDKMTAKNDLQTEHVHNSVGVTEARAVARSYINLNRLSLTKTARNLPPNME